MTTDNNILSNQQQALVPIAAFAAIGNMKQLNYALNEGLDSGLTINEIKEVLVQTYAYAGFPRSLNALNEFMTVLESRRINGVKDVEGKLSTPLPKNYQAYEQGTNNQTQLVGQPVKGAVLNFAPAIDEYLKSHLFGDIFSRDILSWIDREIATVSMLAAMDGVEGQLKAHIGISKHQGISNAQLNLIQSILAQQVSIEAGKRFKEALMTHN